LLSIMWAASQRLTYGNDTTLTPWQET